MTPERTRRLKGSLIIDLIKFLREFQKSQHLPPMSVEAEALLARRLLGSEWYPLKPFVELLALTDIAYLKGKEHRALEMGAAGAMNHLRGIYKAYIKESDPKESVYALRHAWRAHYDFGELKAHLEADRGVGFVLSGYDDLTMPHALMTAGWGLASARLSGAADARVEVLERPWESGSRFVYRILW